MTDRLFKIKMRRGRALLGMTNDGSDAPRAGSAGAVVVDEHTAAFLVRNRAATVVEVVETTDDNTETN
jgi:hypothetical protein